MDKLDTLYKKLDMISKALNLAFKLSVIIGGAVLLFYCWRIEYFPRDVSVGDGLLFIMVAIAFGGIYLFFTLCLTSLGIALKPLWHVLQSVFQFALKLLNKWNNRNIVYKPFRIEQGGKSNFVFAVFGLLFVLGFSLNNLEVFTTLMLSMWVCAFIWSTHQQNSIEIRSIESKDDSSEDEKAKAERLRSHQLLLLIVIISTPLFIGGVTGKLLDGAMRLANVRTEKAVVHIKEPYITYASESGVTGSKSNFGEKYTRIEDVIVLFNGFGGDVVIKAKSESNNYVNLTIPADHVYIIAH